MTIKFYNYTAEQERVDKTSYLGTATTTTADQVEGLQNVLAPSFIVSSNTVPDYNYAYVQEFARYYFVDAPIWIANNTWRVNMRIDVLFTYKTAISAQSGVVQYSSAGSPRKYDPRIVYNLPPVHNAASPVAGYGTPDPVYIVMRVKYEQTEAPANVKHIQNNMMYYVFSKESFAQFSDRFSDFYHAHEQTGVEMAKTIVDISVVFYLDVTGLATSNNVVFASPGITQAYYNDTGNVYKGVPIGISEYPCYVMDNYTVTKSKTAEWLLTVGNYHLRKAQRRIWVPFAGSISADIDKLGLGDNPTFYLAVNIHYEHTTNSYVLTLGSAALTTPSTISLFRDTQVVLPNQHSISFFADLSVEMRDNQIQAQIQNLAANAFGGIVSAVATSGASAPMSIASFGMGIGNMDLAMDRLDYQQASGYGTVGSLNGGSPDMRWIQTVVGPGDTVTYTYPHPVLFTLVTPPNTNLGSFQTAYGYPDGDYKSLSSMTGYVQMGDIILSGMSTVSSTERDEIRRLLLSGVIM